MQKEVEAVRIVRQLDRCVIMVVSEECKKIRKKRSKGKKVLGVEHLKGSDARLRICLSPQMSSVVSLNQKTGLVVTLSIK